jgi:Ser/Thr protein kinase RdoA (MazF antagonist)
MAVRSTLRAQALLEFELPSAPQRADELFSGLPGLSVWRIQAPAGRFLLVCAEAALAVAFEATLFDLLAESRYPAPRPRRARGGALIAKLDLGRGHAAAACYPLSSGESIEAARASTPQLLDLGRLLARLHQIGEAHPASVVAPLRGADLAERLPSCAEAEELVPALRQDLTSLPLGAAHGRLGPEQALYIGDRCAAVLPSGEAHSGPLALDLARAACAWALGAMEVLPAIRAVLSGYQALRRLSPEERDAFRAALRSAAAREGAYRLMMGRRDALEPLRAVEQVTEDDLRAATG